jgi:hypothetical protein
MAKKRAVLALTLAIIFAFTLVSTTTHASEVAVSVTAGGQLNEAAVSVTVDGQLVEFADQQPLIVSDRTLVPVRGVFEPIGFDVDWNSDTRQAILSSDEYHVILTIGSDTFTTNDNLRTLEVPAQIINGRTMLPIRAVLESVGYHVYWDHANRTVVVLKLTPFNINGGTTGAFVREQLNFKGFDGIQAYVTLPFVTYLEVGDCPYVYFGFDWVGDRGNAEGGFQFIDDQAHPYANTWTIFMRQGDSWRWPQNTVSLEQGSTHHLLFYADYISADRTDLVIVLNGIEVVRKESAVRNFEESSVKTVIGMAMTRAFDGQNSLSRSMGARFSNVQVREYGSAEFVDFHSYELYSSWRPDVGPSGMWFGTSVCVPRYVHFEPDGKVSIYKR